jgi:hypothetical protein
VARIAVGLDVDAPPNAVWEQLASIERHVEWMADAVAIEFRSEQTRDVGTTFDCTEWVPGEAMGVAHTGVVSGTGRFTLVPLAGERTRVVWEEDLRFPWWLGGPLGELAGGWLVLRPIWRRNLRRLAALVTAERRA